ncbi:hypothetical protein Goklo_012959, partial [Gossypium klotzschianum]|nr:hypothetical protein [Gossypium klotzschianum]
RGSEGQWVVGYRRNIGVSSILDAKLQAIVDGLKTTWNKGAKEGGVTETKLRNPELDGEELKGRNKTGSKNGKYGC